MTTSSSRKGGPRLSEVVEFLDGFLKTAGPGDWRAVNGLQVDGPMRVERIAGAVDARIRTVRAAGSQAADLLVVHHGILWETRVPVTGRRYRLLKSLIQSETALYSSHEPLDTHPEVGNGIVLARELRLVNLKPFGAYEGFQVGRMGELPEPLSAEQLKQRVRALTHEPVKSLDGGPSEIRTVGVVTGAGGFALAEAAYAGIDALITGEARHHQAIEAEELGVKLMLAGHYATETWGVKALLDVLAEKFAVETSFIDAPTST